MGRDNANLERLRQLIHNKIRERTPMNMGEETWLWRHLRKKDIIDSGELNKEQFIVGMLGVAVGAHDGEVEELFDFYSDDKPMLNYRKFCSEFCHGTRDPKKLQAESKWGTHGESVVYDRAAAIFDRLRAHLFKDSPRELVRLLRAFSECDSQNERLLEHSVFLDVMLDFFADTPIKLTSPQINVIFDYFAMHSRPTYCSYDEFLFELRPQLTRGRSSITCEAWAIIPQKEKGIALLSDIEKQFRADRHPNAMAGKWLKEDVTEEFLDTIIGTIAFLRGIHRVRKQPIIEVGFEEFEDFCCTISSCYEHDADFIEMMEFVWQVDKHRAMMMKPADKSIPAGVQTHQARIDIHHFQPDTRVTNPLDYMVDLDYAFDRNRKLIKKGGLQTAIDVTRTFADIDTDQDDLIDLAEFRCACSKCVISYTHDEEREIFEQLGDGKQLPVFKFLRALHGDMPQERRDLVLEVHAHLKSIADSRGEHIVGLHLLDEFDAGSHPECEHGTQNAHKMKKHFKDTFDQVMNIFGACSDGMVTADDLILYYALVSSIEPSDVHFNLGLRRVWNLDQRDHRKDEDPRNMDLADGFVGGCFLTPNPPSATKNVYDPDDQLQMPTGFNRDAPCSPGTLKPSPFDHRYQTTSPTARSRLNLSQPISKDLSETCANVRKKLSTRGIRGWFSALASMDRASVSRPIAGGRTERNQNLLRPQWERIVKTCALGLSEHETDMVWETFGGREKNMINYNNFLDCCMGPFNSTGRVTDTEKLFDALVLRQFGDTFGNEAVKVDKLISCFDASCHPKVVFNQKQHSEVSEDFVTSVEYYMEKIFGLANVEQCLDEVQFKGFFNYCSAVLINDDEWETFVGRCFPEVMQPRRSKVSYAERG